MKSSPERKKTTVDSKKRFDPSEKDVFCETCGQLMIIETYKWNKDEQAFLLSRRVERPHKKCMGARKTTNKENKGP